MTLVLDMGNVIVYRGLKKVLDGFTLQIEEGCSTAILGPNGAGKTTLLKLVSGEFRPRFDETSHFRVLGQERWNIWDIRSRLGVVSHDLQQEYVASVNGFDVALSGFHSSVGTWSHQSFTEEQLRRAEETITTLGIDGLRDRLYGLMSTGEQRRFLLARTLVHEPDTLLLDEPTSGLDLKSSFQYRDLMRELMRQGTTVLLTTHHVHEIPPETGRVVMVKEGKVFADGRRAEMLTSSRLSELFDCPLRAIWHNDTCQVFPVTRLRRSPASGSTTPDRRTPRNGSATP
jgi:iron complex transport system ATP-binding protein